MSVLKYSISKMKTKILLSIISLISFNLIGQECDCLKNIELLQQKIELNQASYQHQVIEQKRLSEYLPFKTEINNKAKKIISKKDCIALVSLYLSFFRDEHSFVSYIKDYTPKSNAVIKSNRKNEIRSVPFEGIWHFQDGSFSINIFPAKTTFGEYIAVINDDKSKLWKKGQLKIEFFKTSDGTFNCIYWRQNLIPRSFSVTYTDSTLQIGRNLIFHRQKQHWYKHSNTSNNLQFESLSDETNYIRIPSFDLSFKNKIDSLIAVNKITITTKKKLIIDVRDNGGGGFDAFKSILPFILDSGVTETPYYGSVWLSKDNFEYYDQTKFEYSESQQDSTIELKYVEFLRGHINHFSPIERSNDTIALEENSPSKIAIIYNRNTASSAEGFILQARNSEKVKTYGENSAGAVSYGDWMPFNLPELNIWVAITAKKMIFKNNEDFESIGIVPEIDLTNENENEWLNIVLEKMR
jgi:hypothetical protein